MFALLSSKIKMLSIAAVAASGLAAGSQAASALDSFLLNLSFAAPILVAPAPVCVQQPVVVAPAYIPAPVCAPVVVAAAPTLIYSAPVYQAVPYPIYHPEHIYLHDGHGFHDHRW